MLDSKNINPRGKEVGGMDCILCHGEMRFMSKRLKPRSGEVEEEQFLCPKCGCYVVIRYDCACTWYDKNDIPMHPTHDK